MLRWADLREHRPDAWVLSRETGHNRPYGENPYVGYDSEEWTLLDQPVDGRLPAKERVVVVLDSSVAFPLSQLTEQPVANVDVHGRQVVLFAAPGLASALDTRAIAEGRPIPATGVFTAVVDGQVLTFESTSDPGLAARDSQTGSGWTLLGEAVDGPLTGAKLERLAHIDTFWFAAKAFDPDLEVGEVSR
jgi:hypothetical protein